MLKIHDQTSFGRPPYGSLSGTIGLGDGEGASERWTGEGTAVDGAESVVAADS